MSLFHIPRDVLFDLKGESIPDPLESREIVRLTTSVWSDKRGVHTKRSLMHLRRKCRGCCAFKEGVSAIGANEALGLITNLHECKDGVYEIYCTTTSHDWETGYPDEWEYCLVPYTED